MRKQLAAHLIKAIFSVHSAYFNYSRQKVPYIIISHQNRVESQWEPKSFSQKDSLWQFPLAHSPAHSPVHSGSLCLTLALTGSLLLSNFAYTVIARLAAPLPRWRTLSRSGHADDYLWRSWGDDEIPDICQFWYTTALFDGCDSYQLWVWMMMTMR